MRFPTNSSSSSFDATTDENSIVREEEEDQSAFFNRRQSVLSVGESDSHRQRGERVTFSKLELPCLEATVREI